MPRTIGSLAASITTAGSMILLGSAMLIAGPILESHTYPVVADVRYRVVERGQNRMTLDWWGRKRRACEIISATALVRWYGTLIPAELSRGDDATDAPLPYTTRPATADHEQQFRRMDVVPDGDAILLELRHRCHGLWASVTRVPLTVLP